MASKTTYELEVRLGGSTSPSWKATLGKVSAGLQRVNSLSNKIMSGMAAGVAATAGTATYALSNAVNTYTSFEQEMATVQSISGASATEFLAMKEAALEAGSSTVFTATEAASALEYMSLAGWDVNTSISGLSPILQMAAATGKELQTTSDLVTDSMSALGLEVDELDMYLDKLVKTNNSANATAEQLMEALVKTGGASRTLGADLDDTITALGVLANNGLKGTEAGTALNAIFTRLFGNTTAIKELNKLGVDLWTDAGKFVGFEEGLDRIHAALSELDDEQAAFSLKNIAGTHYSSQMTYLLESRELNEGSDTNAWDMLEEKVTSSNGALKNMYDITTDTLLNAQKRLQSAKEDMQIRLVDVFSDDAKGFVSWLADSLPTVTESIVDFAETHEGEFAKVLEGLEDGIENLWENGIAAGKWIIQNKRLIIGALSSMAGSMGLLKAATMGINIVKFFTNPLSAGVTVAGMAITAIGGIIGAFRDAEAAATSADLASRFGEIALSMEDVERVAEHIIGSENLTGVLSSLDEFDALKSISGIMEDASKELEKTHWKLSVGMELTNDEKENYKKAIDDYITSAQEYARQAQYAVSIGMEFAFDESYANADSVGMKVQKFYQDNQSLLSQLGYELNEAVTAAFNDGIFEIYEMPVIADLQRQIAEVEKSLAIGEMDAQWALLEADYAGLALTPDSFANVLEEIDRQTEEAMEVYKEAYIKNYSAISNTHEGGGMSDAEYKEAINELNKKYESEKASVSMRGLDFALNTIYSGYNNEIGQYEEVLTNVIAKYSDTAYDNVNWTTVFESMMQDIASEGPDKASRHAVEELIGLLDTPIAELYALIEDWDNLTPELQAAVQTRVAQIETLQGMSVNVSDLRWGKAENAEGLYRDITNKIYGSNEGASVKGYVDQYYEDLTGYTRAAAYGLESGLEASKTETIQPAIEGVYAFSQALLNEVFSQGLSVSSDVNLAVNPKLNLTGYAENTAIMHNARGGIYNSPILTTFAEEGPEAAVPLDGSLRAKQLWMQAGQILGTLPNGTRDQVLLNGINAMDKEEDTGRSIQIIFNPSITIQGNASIDEVQSALTLSMDELREMLKEIQREDARVAFK